MPHELPRSPFRDDPSMEMCVNAIVTFSVAASLRWLANNVCNEVQYEAAVARTQPKLTKLTATYIEKMLSICDRSLCETAPQSKKSRVQ